MNIKKWIPLIMSCSFVGCASVPVADLSRADQVKKFAVPQDGNAGIYIYRSNSLKGAALKKDIWLDGKCVGETARGTFFYQEVKGGQNHTISTESEFSPNHLKMNTASGQNYFVQQSLKMGAFVGGASLKLVDESIGRQAISTSKLAESGKCSKPSILLTPQ